MKKSLLTKALAASHPAPQAAAEGVGSIGDDAEFCRLAQEWANDDCYPDLLDEKGRNTWQIFCAYIDNRAAPERAAIPMRKVDFVNYSIPIVYGNSTAGAAIPQAGEAVRIDTDGITSAIALDTDKMKLIFKSKAAFQKFQTQLHASIFNAAPAPDAEAIRSAALEEAAKVCCSTLIDSPTIYEKAAINKCAKAIRALSQPSPAVKSAEPDYAEQQRQERIGEAVCYWRMRWPDELPSGIMFFNGARITRDEFNARAALAKSAETTGGAASQVDQLEEARREGWAEGMQEATGLLANEVADAGRLDWLENMCVNVRVPLRYGSRDLFWASPEDDDGESKPSSIRAQIDAALSAGETKGGGHA